MKKNLFRECSFKEFRETFNNVTLRFFTKSTPYNISVFKLLVAFVMIFFSQSNQNLFSAGQEDSSLLFGQDHKIGVAGIQEDIACTPGSDIVGFIQSNDSGIKSVINRSIEPIKTTTPFRKRVTNKKTRSTNHSHYNDIDHESFLGTCLGVYLMITPLLLIVILFILSMILNTMPEGFTIGQRWDIMTALREINHQTKTISSNKKKSTPADSAEKQQ